MILKRLFRKLSSNPLEYSSDEGEKQVFQSKMINLESDPFKSTKRKLVKKSSFHQLFWLLFEGEILVGRYYCYENGGYSDVLLVDFDTFAHWQQAEEAGTHLLEEVYAVTC